MATSRWRNTHEAKKMWREPLLMSQMLHFSLNVLCVRGTTLDEPIVSERWSPCILLLSVKFRWRWLEPLSWLFTKSGCCSKVLIVLWSGKSRPEEPIVSVRWSPCILFPSVRFRWRWTEPLSWLSGCCSKVLVVLEGQRSAKSRPEERFLDMT